MPSSLILASFSIIICALTFYLTTTVRQKYDGAVRHSDQRIDVTLLLSPCSSAHLFFLPLFDRHWDICIRVWVLLLNDFSCLQWGTGDPFNCLWTSVERFSVPRRWWKTVFLLFSFANDIVRCLNRSSTCLSRKNKRGEKNVWRESGADDEWQYCRKEIFVDGSQIDRWIFSDGVHFYLISLIEMTTISYNSGFLNRFLNNFHTYGQRKKNRPFRWPNSDFNLGTFWFTNFSKDYLCNTYRDPVGLDFLNTNALSIKEIAQTKHCWNYSLIVIWWPDTFLLSDSEKLKW